MYPQQSLAQKLTVVERRRRNGVQLRSADEPRTTAACVRLCEFILIRGRQPNRRDRTATASSGLDTTMLRVVMASKGGRMGSPSPRASPETSTKHRQIAGDCAGLPGRFRGNEIRDLVPIAITLNLLFTRLTGTVPCKASYSIAPCEAKRRFGLWEGGPPTPPDATFPGPFWPGGSLRPGSSPLARHLTSGAWVRSLFDSMSSRCLVVTGPLTLTNPLRTLHQTKSTVECNVQSKHGVRAQPYCCPLFEFESWLLPRRGHRRVDSAMSYDGHSATVRWLSISSPRRQARRPPRIPIEPSPMQS